MCHVIMTKDVSGRGLAVSYAFDERCMVLRVREDNDIGAEDRAECGDSGSVGHIAAREDQGALGLVKVRKLALKLRDKEEKEVENSRRRSKNEKEGEERKKDRD
jgi:hypothetical protein